MRRCVERISFLQPQTPQGEPIERKSHNRSRTGGSTIQERKADARRGESNGRIRGGPPGKDRQATRTATRARWCQTEQHLKILTSFNAQLIAFQIGRVDAAISLRGTERSRLFRRHPGREDPQGYARPWVAYRDHKGRTLRTEQVRRPRMRLRNCSKRSRKASQLSDRSVPSRQTL